MTTTTPKPDTAPKVAMLFDGGCPLCSKEVAHYRRLDKQDKVEWADIHADPTILEQYDIAYLAAMKHLHVIDLNGSVVIGAPAFAVVWAQLPGYRFLAHVTALPGVLPVLDRLYRWFADKRFAKRMSCAGPEK